MYGIEVVTPPASLPVPAVDLRTHLRLNDAAEDGELAEFVGAAVDRFEADTRRPVLATVYRQSLAAWPGGLEVALGRGGVTAVAAVRRFTGDDTTEDLAGWGVDLKTPPARVVLAALPDPVEHPDGRPLSPVGYVQFTAGWPSPAAVPKDVKVAIKLLAAHFYRNREAFKDSAFEMRQLPSGWAAVCAHHKLALTGDWDQ